MSFTTYTAGVLVLSLIGAFYGHFFGSTYLRGVAAACSAIAALALLLPLIQ